jgi:cobalamin biosynthesis protein CobT
METFRSQKSLEMGTVLVAPAQEHWHHTLGQNREAEILTQYTAEQQQEIKHKQQILSSLAYFIGKDFHIPVELNEAGEGWYWDFKANVIRIDPQDLLEKPMDYLRFVICHEGGHRRISRTGFIPEPQWQEPGFAFMMNAIEDPRDNNFVAESYPRFRDQMALAYQQDLDFEAKAKDKAAEELGYTPRFMQAGFEYIKQWFREAQGKEFEISGDLHEDVSAVVHKTLAAAQDSWWRYPSRQEADSGEEAITQYAKVSYEINRNRVWPDFKKLVEQDIEDQKKQEALEDMQKGDGEVDGIPQELKDKLNDQEKQELQDVVTQGSNPVNLDSLSESLKEKIQEYIASLPENKKRELIARAVATLKEFEDALNKELKAQLAGNSEEEVQKKVDSEVEASSVAESKRKDETVGEEDLERYRESLAKELRKDENVYEQLRREVLPIIDKLENELREIFVARRAQAWKGGFKTGKRINIKRRIQEKAKDVPVMESKAWQKREQPKEKDYAITILIDLSGSMASNDKIRETFKAVIILAEVLNRLSIKTEILGFNDRLYPYQTFGQPFSSKIREVMGGMLEEVNDSSDTGKARYNDDGWALQQASERLGVQEADQKFLIVLSDGMPEESPMHPRSKYDLKSAIEQITEEVDQKLVGLGIGSGTAHVSEYYPNSIANVKVKEMSEKLADLIREVIANYGSF